MTTPAMAAAAMRGATPAKRPRSPDRHDGPRPVSSRQAPITNGTGKTDALSSRLANSVSKTDGRRAGGIGGVESVKREGTGPTMISKGPPKKVSSIFVPSFFFADFPVFHSWSFDLGAPSWDAMVFRPFVRVSNGRVESVADVPCSLESFLTGGWRFSVE